MRRQWSWPLWLPVQAFGIFPASVLVNDDASTPWAGEIEQKIFASAVGERLCRALTRSLAPLHHQRCWTVQAGCGDCRVMHASVRRMHL